MRKPRLLDLFCGAGGAAMGYHRAGFEVVGVDIAAQKHYPFEFHQGDAMTWPLEGYDTIHASPPRQAFTAARVIHGRQHPDLLTPTRKRLQDWGGPWVIENVPGAPMRPDVVLCGSMFRPLRIRRHRWFESNMVELFALRPPCQHDPSDVSVFGHGGHVYHGVADWRDAMGIPWMTRDELAQAIPPAYTEFIGAQLLAALESAA
jgi:DNA (cytosine-5)-methyltransferase 1